MNIAIAQINSTIGAFADNTRKILDFAQRAKSQGADFVIFPELAICGYPPMDLLDQESFVQGNIQSLSTLRHLLPNYIAVGVGYVQQNLHDSGKPLVNAFGVIHNGRLVFEQIKTLLPTYDVFDEARNFKPASAWNFFEWMDQRIGFAICEDVWRETGAPGTNYAEDPVQRLLDAGITLLCVPSASPFYAGKQQQRLEIAKNIAARGGVPLAYINAVGANDSIIFDGRSFFLNNGELQSAKAFEEDILFVQDIKGGSLPPVQHDVAAHPPLRGMPPQRPLTGGQTISTSEYDVIEDALVLGIRDYMAKCGFKKAHLGLSGGIDSALTAYLAIRAVGPENVTAISMPSRFSSQGSKDDAKELAQNLGCRYEVLPIEPIFKSFLQSLDGVFEGRPFDIAEENLQARVRGSLLMAFSNKWNSMLLTTGNKSELAMGYCTLYGDMNGALCPIGDLFKTEVFELCRVINQKSQEAVGLDVIPLAIIEKPPSAELRPNQKDQDSLPPYEILDNILRLYLFENLSAEQMAKRGIDKKLAADIIKTTARAEFKRRQAPPVLKVSPRAFGMGRRMPIARNVYECNTEI